MGGGGRQKIYKGGRWWVVGGIERRGRTPHPSRACPRGRPRNAPVPQADRGPDPGPTRAAARHAGTRSHRAPAARVSRLPPPCRPAHAPAAHRPPPRRCRRLRPLRHRRVPRHQTMDYSSRSRLASSHSTSRPRRAHRTQSPDALRYVSRSHSGQCAITARYRSRRRPATRGAARAAGARALTRERRRRPLRHVTVPPVTPVRVPLPTAPHPSTLDCRGRPTSHPGARVPPSGVVPLSRRSRGMYSRPRHHGDSERGESESDDDREHGRMVRRDQCGRIDQHLCGTRV